ncbi:sigma-70 family RNA polymerase sigma factor [Actinoplanes sp. NPDC051633]|uniref:RNA polymerase sigma factor n=1 Tax=Actinoplanes sp. NPDC051633 TaxID=3155670 RepID=UPI003417DCAC
MFDPFFEEMYPELLRIGLVYCRNWHDVDDGVATILAEVRLRWFTINNHRAYARVALIRFVKRLQKSSPERLTDYGAHEELPQFAEVSADLGDYEGRQWVDQKLAVLPTVQRTVMQLYVDGWTFAEIAEQIGSSAPTVRRNISYARERLEKDLEAYRPRTSDSVTTRKEAG